MATYNGVISKAGVFALPAAADTFQVPGTLQALGLTMSYGGGGVLTFADGSTQSSAAAAANIAYSGNVIQNGGLEYWQRGTTISATIGVNSRAWVADRWYIGAKGSNSPIVVSRTALAYTEASGVTRYALRMQRPAGNTVVSTRQLYHEVDRDEAVRLRAKPVRMTFYARKGADFSSTTLTLSIMTGTGADSETLFAGTGGLAYTTGGAFAYTGAVTLGTNWSRYDVDLVPGADITTMGIVFNQSNTSGTAGTNDWYEIAALSMHVGQVTRDFEYYGGGGNSTADLQACLKYYEKSYQLATDPGSSTTAGVVTLKYPMPASGSPPSFSAGSMVAYVRFMHRKWRTPVVADVTFYNGTGTAGQWNGPGSVQTATGVISDTSMEIQTTNSWALTQSSVNNCYGHWVVDCDI